MFTSGVEDNAGARKNTNIKIEYNKLHVLHWFIFLVNDAVKQAEKVSSGYVIPSRRFHTADWAVQFLALMWLKSELIIL